MPTTHKRKPRVFVNTLTSLFPPSGGGSLPGHEPQWFLWSLGGSPNHFAPHPPLRGGGGVQGAALVDRYAAIEVETHSNPTEHTKGGRLPLPSVGGAR